MVHLILNSVPTGAKIYRDNLYIGTTPYDESFNDGTYKIELTRTGYKTYLNLNWKLSGTITKTITLEKEIIEIPPEPTEIRIRSEPSGARIWLDGKDTGETTPETFEVSPGKHNIILKLEGYDDYSASPSAAAEKTLTFTYNLKVIVIAPPIPPPPIPPEITWWEKLRELSIGRIEEAYLKYADLWKQGYKYLTGRVMDDEEYERVKLTLLDWVLPVNILMKLFVGKNLKGEAEEFGGWEDWLYTTVMLAAFLIPGPADDVAAQFGAKTITKAGAERLTAKMGEKATADALIKVVKTHPETSAKFLSKFPVAVRNAVINGLGRTAYGREAIYILGKTNYFKYTAPGLKGILAKVGTGPKWFLTLVGAAAGYLTFANFLAWIGKEALVETLSFPIWTLIDSKDWQGVLDHVGALRESISLADKAMILTKPIPLISDIWKAYIDNANTQADIYEKVATDALAELIEKGNLTVNCNIANSDVYIDGSKVGTTPFTRELDVGWYHVLVTKFQYTSFEVDVNVQLGSDLRVTAEINPLAPPPTGKGTLDISVEPTDAVLLVAGHPEITKMGAYELDLGSYTIEASKEGYYSKSMTGIVKEAEITDVSIVLTEKPPVIEKATLNLTSEPTNAKIYIDGEYKFVQTPYQTKLDAGAYTIRMELQGYIPKEESVTLASAEIKDVNFVLEEEVPTPPVPTGNWKVSVSSSPQGAKIIINGYIATREGNVLYTPDYVILKPGTYDFTVYKPGYKVPTPKRLVLEEY